jgi:DNA polymerase-3 subunit delta
MKYSEFLRYKPKQASNVFAFICGDEFLLEESRSVWKRIFGGEWVFDKYSAKEFEEISGQQLMEEALTPSLFTQNRILIVTNAEKLKKGRLDDLMAVQDVPQSSLRIVLSANSRKTIDGWPKNFPVVEIDSFRAEEVARFLMDRQQLTPEVASYLVESVGADLFQLHTEAEKLRTFVGKTRSIETRDVDVLILRSEQFGPFELDDAVLARDYKKAVQVIGAMLGDGMEPLIILSRIVRVWRQLFVGKSLVGKRSAKEVAAATLVPAFKAGEFTNSCKRFDWKQLASGFRLLLDADRAFKTSTPNAEGYFDIMLWKMIRQSEVR